MANQIVNLERLAFALWCESPAISKLKLKDKVLEDMWQMVLNPPADDPMWAPIKGHWMKIAERVANRMDAMKE